MNLRGGETPPPVAVFWATFLGDDLTVAMPQALSLQAVCAVVAGVVFHPMDASLRLATTRCAGGIVWSIIYAMILLIGAMVFWGKLVLEVYPIPNRGQPSCSPTSPGGLGSGSSAPQFPFSSEAGSVGTVLYIITGTKDRCVPRVAPSCPPRRPAARPSDDRDRGSASPILLHPVRQCRRFDPPAERADRH